MLGWYLIVNKVTVLSLPTPRPPTTSYMFMKAHIIIMLQTLHLSLNINPFLGLMIKHSVLHSTKLTHFCAMNMMLALWRNLEKQVPGKSEQTFLIGSYSDQSLGFLFSLTWKWNPKYKVHIKKSMELVRVSFWSSHHSWCSDKP